MKTTEEKETTHVCGNCSEEWTDADLEKNGTLGIENIPDLYQRIDPGSDVPSGECPDCGALTYEHDAEEDQKRRDAELNQRLRNKRYSDLHKALEDVALRTVQARIASGIGRKKASDRVDFLLGELERIREVARKALAEGKEVPNA